MCFSKPKKPKRQPVLIEENAAEVQAALAKEKELARLRRGRASTILTSHAAGLDSARPQKTLLES